MSIVVTNPISTSKWKKGTEYTITWTGGWQEIEYIKLYKSTVEIETIGTDLRNYGEYLWTPGAGLVTGNDYFIKIYDGINTAWSDEFLIYSAFTVQLNDGLGLGDSMSKAPEKVLSDDLDLSDAVLRFIGRVLLDNLNLSDSIVKQIVKVLSDNLNLSDSMVKQINKVLSDNLTLSDSIVRKITRPYLVYDTMRDSWCEFDIGSDTGVIIQAVSLTAGDTLENSNLLLQEYEDTTTKQDINKYPTSEISTNIFYKIRTKDFYYEKGVLRRVYLSYKLDDPGNTKPTLASIVKTENVATTTKTHNIEEVGSNIWYGVANSKSRGRDFSVIVYNADIIEYINLDFKIRAIG